MKKYISIIILLFFLSCNKKAAVLAVTPVETPLLSDTVTTSTANFKGLNWADPRDNFADDWLVPTGLNSADNYATTIFKSDTILAAFRKTGANTIRLPINPQTVLQNWWLAYSAAIDRASAKGMKVIVGCWEGASSKDGKVDDMYAFWKMWKAVVDKYITNPNVYFEVFNEPHGYTIAELKDLYSQWLTTYPNVPKRRIMLDGAGYANDVNSIGSDSRYDSCLLSFHEYTWFESRKTVADWEVPVKSIRYPKRTVVTEFGIPMTSHKDYSGAPGDDVEITYFQGMTNQMHDLGMGGVYWPGLRSGDTYSLLSLNGNTVSTNNLSGLSRLQYAWGTGEINAAFASFVTGNTYKILNRNSNKSLAVEDSAVTQWKYSANLNQQWKFNSTDSGCFAIVNVSSGKVLGISGGTLIAGAGIIQSDFYGGTSQQWQVTDIGFGYYKIINKNTGQALDVNGGSVADDAGIIQWYWNNGTNQQWQILKL